MTNLQQYAREIENHFGITREDQLFEVELKSRRHLDLITERGVNLDKEVLKREELRVGAELMELQKEIFYGSRGTIIKANSSAQVANFLESEGIRLKRNGKGNPRTRTEDIEEIDHPIIPGIIAYRSLLSSHSQISSVLYADSERAHPNFDSLSCPTGRIYSSAPNIMGWSETTQEAIIPDEGYHVLKADYKAQDLRVLAALSDCVGLKKAFEEKQDPHTWVSSLLLKKRMEDITDKERDLGKAINFGTVYRQKPEGLAFKTKCSVQEAYEFHSKYHDLYPEIGEWSNEEIKKVKRTGFSSTFFGRKRWINIPEVYGRSTYLREKGERQAVNTPVQGTGADLIKKALAKIPSNSDKIQVLFPWHDALVLQYRIGLDEDKVKSYIESVMAVSIKDVKMEVEW